MILLTVEGLKSIAPRGKSTILKAVASVLMEHGPRHGVSTAREVCHFLAQAAHESDGFRTTQEYASGEAYEGRKDLGNTRPGDGRRYKGRGIFQLTGRFNYRQAGKALGLDLEANPRLAADPATSVLIALWYWRTRGLSKYANRDNIREITRRINGGFNGFADRVRYFRKAWAVYGQPKSMLTGSTTNIVAAGVGTSGALGAPGRAHAADAPAFAGVFGHPLHLSGRALAAGRPLPG
jgi:putative chitinase